MARQLVEHEGDRRGRRVVAGEQQRHHLVAHLAVAQGGAVLGVGRLDQHRQHVLAIRVRLPAAALDLGVDDAVERLARRLQAAPRGARAAHDAHGEVRAVEAERALELDRRLRALALLVRVEPEQRAHRDPQRQAARPVVDVEHVAALPAGERLQRLVDHRVVRGEDPLAVEGGQHDAARAAVVGAVDRQQAVAEQGDQVAHAPGAPVELVGVRDGDEVVGLGAEHEDHAPMEHAGAEDRAVLPVERQQDREWISHEAERALEVEVVRSRGKRHGRDPLRLQVGHDSQKGVAGERLGRRCAHAGERTGWLARMGSAPSHAPSATR